MLSSYRSLYIKFSALSLGPQNLKHVLLGSLRKHLLLRAPEGLSHWEMVPLQFEIITCGCKHNVQSAPRKSLPIKQDTIVLILSHCCTWFWVTHTG